MSIRYVGERSCIDIANHFGSFDEVFYPMWKVAKTCQYPSQRIGYDVISYLLSFICMYYFYYIGDEFANMLRNIHNVGDKVTLSLVEYINIDGNRTNIETALHHIHVLPVMEYKKKHQQQGQEIVDNDHHAYNKNTLNLEPLHNRNIVITGKLNVSKYTRNEVNQMCHSLGGKVKNIVNKQTDILIVGDHNYNSSKYKQAIQWNNKNPQHKIEIWEEEKFLTFLSKYAVK